MDERTVKEIVCDFDNLHKAMWKCKQNVIWKDSVAGFVIVNGLVNCYKLRQAHLKGNYKIDKYTCFKVYEPKERDIVSTRIKDRVFQRSLSDNYLSKELAKGFIYDSGACLKNKGTEFTRKRLYVHLKRHYRKFGIIGGILQCDLSNYFGSTPHKTASNSVEKRLNDKWAIDEVNRIINSFNQGENPDIGMGLGSQITQCVQLAVMDDIDHIIKEVLRIKNYIRYNDDFILTHHNTEYLKYCKEVIDREIKALGLKLSTKKTQVQPITQPIHFLGFSYMLTETGKIICKALRKKVNFEKRKLRKLVNRAKQGLMTKADVDRSYNSWKAHISGKSKQKGVVHLKRNTHSLILKMDKFYKSLWEEQL